MPGKMKPWAAKGSGMKKSSPAKSKLFSSSSSKKSIKTMNNPDISRLDLKPMSYGGYNKMAYDYEY